MDSNKRRQVVYETNLCIPNYDNVLHKLAELNNMEKCVHVVKQLMRDKSCDKNKDDEFIIVKKKSKGSMLNVIYHYSFI